MIIPDVNLLIYAYDETTVHHHASRTWLMDCLAGSETFGLAISTIIAFYRLATDRRVFRSPLSLEDVNTALQGLLGNENTIIVLPGDRHYQLFTQLVLQSRATRDLIPDAHLAASAIEHGGVIHTNDHDFDRFPSVRVEYPLAAR